MRSLCLAVVAAVLAAAFGLCRTAAADVVVQGTVKYWDELEEDFVPARMVRVEVERDWAISDPSGLTNDQGFYSVKLPGPWFDDHHDGVHIEVHAETPDRFQVCSAMLSSYAYQAFSIDFDNVKDKKTFTIDLRFGKPASVKKGLPNLNVKGVSHRTHADTAKAFLVHAEMLAHYRALRAMGWPDAAFDEKEVLVPAAGVLPYYNHVTGFINLVTANWSGTAAWPALPTGDHPGGRVTGQPAGRFNVFRHTVRHEYSHAIHDEITQYTPVGLGMPAFHDPWSASNPHLAFTEGFADLLPLMTLGRPHLWEDSDRLVGQSLLKGDHGAMEGEVTALLWDLFDPQGYEVLRHPSSTTPYGKAVPDDVRKLQRWMDGLEDGRGLHIRNTASKTRMLLPGGAWDRIRLFLNDYKAAIPAKTHELKAVAFNRDITGPLPVETPARVEGTVSLRRRGSRVTLSCTVREDDAEDRPHVRLNAYTGRTAMLVRQVPGLKNLVLTGGWNGARRSVTTAFDMPVGFRPGDPLWLEVNDDMLPTVYELSIPVKDDGVVEAAPTHDHIASAYGDLPSETRNRLDGLAQLGTMPSTVPGATLGPTTARTVDFESAPRRWQFTGSAAVAEVGGGRALTTGGYSFGVWDTGPLERFGLRFRYRHGHGVGGVALSVASAGDAETLYHLAMRDDAVVLSREADRLEAELGASNRTFEAGRWYDVAVQYAKGDFRISVDGAVVLAVRDHEPLPGGTLAFGSLLGAGFAFDDIALTGASLEPGAASPGDAVPPGVARRTNQDGDDIRTLRALIRESRQILREHEERKDLQARQRRALYRLASEQGGLSVKSPPGDLIPVVRIELAEASKLTVLQQADLQKFDAWLSARAAGTPPARAIHAAMRPLLAEQVRATDAAIVAAKAMPQRAADVSRRLSEAGARFSTRTYAFRTETAAAVAELEVALKQIGEDTQLLVDLETQRKAVDTLRK